MAAHKPLWGPVENQMMEELFEPEYLRRKIPGIGEILDGAAMLRSVNEEIGILGEYHKQAGGFTKGRFFQNTAKIDTNIMLMLEELHEASCTCGNGLWGSKGHKAWYYNWLNGPGKAHDVRGKIVL